jgi:L-aminopeptidase/D-esterase-like protein
MPVRITDIEGVSVGHASDFEALTGVTVILAPSGMTGAAAISGFAASTRQIDALSPSHIVTKAHAICIAGGSAYGLEAASGVMGYLEERGYGFDVGIARIPIVPTAAIFDLRVGSAQTRPDKTMGYLACQQASKRELVEGSVGAGTGATVGKFYGIEQAMKGGIGIAADALDSEVIVAALAVVNAFGDVRDPNTGRILAGARKDKNSREFVDTGELMRKGVCRPRSAFENTTVGVVVTNAKLHKQSASIVATMASLGMAKVLNPAHTLYDGDIVFVLASGETEVDFHTVGLMAEQMLMRATIRGVTTARELKGIPSFLSLTQ